MAAPKKLSKSSPAAQQALAGLNAQVGFDVSSVLNPDTWAVYLVEGAAQVVVNVEGMSALACFSPRPDAAEVVADIIAIVKQGDSK